MTPPIRVLALEWNTQILIDVLVELSRDHGWEPVYCVSVNQQEQLKQLFPSAIYHDTHQARYARPAPELADMPLGVLDQPTAEAIGYSEVMALKQMDRMELMGGFALHDRIIHFHRLAGYWSAVLDRFRPDVVLMPTSPHVVYDYVTYTLARRRGIPTVMFEYVASDGLLAAIDGFEDGIPALMAEYRRLLADPPTAPLVLSDRMETYWKNIRGTYDEAMPYWTRAVNSDAATFERARAAARALEQEEEQQALAKTASFARFLSRLRSRLARLRSALASILEDPRQLPTVVLGLGRAIRNYWAVPTPPLPPATDGHNLGTFYRQDETPVDLARAVARQRSLHIETVSRRYDELAVIPDLDRPYVYVALHGQPERATNPNGGVFDDQDVMIRMIASALPEGWHVYVKEHPAQFMPHFASERGRWATFYDAVLAHPAVSLVSRSTPSFELIDRARAVASLTGTSSWEAIARGVPALVFGEPWYKGCDGAHTVRTYADCEQALARIAAGQRPDPITVRLFLLAAEKTSTRGFLSPDDETIAGIDHAASATNLARAVAECYRAPAAASLSH